MGKILRIAFEAEGKNMLLVSERMPKESKNEHLERIAITMQSMIETAREEDEGKQKAIISKYLPLTKK
jgi:hypothetical protein